MRKAILSIVAILFMSEIIHAQNVGIGTTIPAMGLHVSKASDTALMQLENRTTLNTNTNVGLYFKNGNYYTGAIKTIGGSTYTSRLSFFTFSDPGQNGLVERVSILDNGNVGINVVSPTARMDINGTLRIRGNDAADGKVLTSDANGNATWQAPANTNAGIGFYARLANNLTLADGVETDLTSYVEKFDDGGVFNPSTGRFTAPTAGVYQISFTITFQEQGTASKLLEVDIKKNNGLTASFNYAVPGLNVNAPITYSNDIIMKLAASDYISLAVTRYQTGGSTLQGGSFTAETHFSAYKIY